MQYLLTEVEYQQLKAEAKEHQNLSRLIDIMDNIARHSRESKTDFETLTAQLVMNAQDGQYNTTLKNWEQICGL